jgi:DNA-binding NarL/FixJ family response regulator
MTIKVLIADDQALVRSGLRAIIESEPGMEVTGEAGDGAEAVEAVRRLRPHVALMDIRMPRLDGVAATRALLRGAAPVPTKILILTTFHLDAYVTEALRAGASGFLLKDATADQLTEAVRVIASGEAILAPPVTRRLLETMAEDPAGDGGRQIRNLLSAREVDVLLLVARGLSNAEISATLQLAETTVKSHVQSMLGKLGVRDRLQAAIAAYDSGLVRPRGS